MNNKLQPLIRLFITNQTRRMCLRANGVAYVTKHTLQGMYPMTKKGRALKKNRFEAAYSTIRLTKDDFLQIKKRNDLRLSPWSIQALWLIKERDKTYF